MAAKTNMKVLLVVLYADASLLLEEETRKADCRSRRSVTPRVGGGNF